MLGLRAGIYCPDCRSELVHDELSSLVCPGCTHRFWQRGAELCREGEYEPVGVPDTQVPSARARIRKRED